jgi:hypothetical protein
LNMLAPEVYDGMVLPIQMGKESGIAFVR